MHLVAVTLTCSDPVPPRLAAGAVTDLIWLHCRRADRVEHIRTRVDLDRCRIAAAIIADTPDAAAANLRSVCERALQQVPALRGWRLSLT
ncbi:hypothetical protein [Kitasatospora griseola]|uniref:hypothetical protein n=1 Tax=Kitasatospora griseola TaxID=2064 RepID=UPI000AD9095B|nr:hypothetical protein [Kitasatospora griseola]GGQ85844.1 hypothetical protein GCM10010195_46940 [Kitasatospora griseola]